MRGSTLNFGLEKVTPITGLSSIVEFVLAENAAQLLSDLMWAGLVGRR